MPQYFNTTAAREIAALTVKFDEKAYNHVRLALFLLLQELNNLRNGLGLSFPLYAPDSFYYTPQYSFENGVDTGLSFDSGQQRFIIALYSKPLLTFYLNRFLLGANDTDGLNVGRSGVNPAISHISAFSAAAGDTDIQGGRLDINAGQGTGAASIGGLGTQSLIRIRVSPNAGSGSALNALKTALNIHGRRWTIGGDEGVPLIINSGGGQPQSCVACCYDSVGTDQAGANIFLRGGAGTGAGTSSKANLQTSETGTTGSTAQTVATRFTADEVGSVSPSGHWYREPSGRKTITAQFDKTNTTLADITGSTVALKAGRTYKFRAQLFVDASAAGGHKYAIAISSAPTSIIYQINSIDNTALALKIASRQTASGGAAGEASGTTYETIIEGLVVANAAANLTVQFAQNAASGTSSVLVGSSIIVEDMGS